MTTYMLLTRGLRYPMNTSLRALNLVESACVGVTSTFMALLANSLTNSYILVGAIVTGYGLAQALSYTLTLARPTICSKAGGCE
jgi:hypothetical protein